MQDDQRMYNFIWAQIEALTLNNITVGVHAKMRDLRSPMSRILQQTPWRACTSQWCLSSGPGSPDSPPLHQDTGSCQTRWSFPWLQSAKLHCKCEVLFPYYLFIYFKGWDTRAFMAFKKGQRVILQAMKTWCWNLICICWCDFSEAFEVTALIVLEIWSS